MADGKIAVVTQDAKSVWVTVPFQPSMQVVSNAFDVLFATAADVVN